MDDRLVDEVQLLHDRVCKGLGDPKRVLILYALNEKPCYVSELSDQLDMPQPTVSRHLKILRDCCLVTTRRDGNAVYYAINDGRVIEALDLLRGILRDRIMEQAHIIEHHQ